MANNVDQNEVAHYERPQLELHCLQIQLFSLFFFCTLSGDNSYHDSSSGCSMLSTSPALSNIRTLGLLTDCVQFQISEILFDSVVVPPHWYFCFKPPRKSHPETEVIYQARIFHKVKAAF